MSTDHRIQTFDLMRRMMVVAILVFLAGCQFLARNTTTSTDVMLGEARVTAYSTAADHKPPQELVQLNQLFRDAYKARLDTVKKETTPVIVDSLGMLELHWNRQTKRELAIPGLYHSLKSIAHAPFGIVLRVHKYAQQVNGLLPEEVLSALADYRDRLPRANQSLTDSGFSQTQLRRQQEILEECENYVSRLLSTKNVSIKELLSFAQLVGPKMLANAADAARVQIDRTHGIVMGWKKEIPMEEWERLVVVVRGFQMARRLNISTQYFARLLNEPAHNLGYPLESKRLIFAEFISKDRTYLDLMATTFIDGDASEMFFGDRWRMSRDVLADGAQEYIKTLKFE